MEMRLDWTNNELNDYQRSMVELVIDENSFKPKEVRLQGAEQIKAALKEYDMSLVNKLAVGYDMSHEKGQDNVYMLKPAWFVNYGPNHDWQPLFHDSRKPGERTDGLEKNKNHFYLNVLDFEHLPRLSIVTKTGEKQTGYDL